jgi:ABC-2 type transport system permease protein
MKSVILSEGGALAAVVEGPAVAFVVARSFASDLSCSHHIQDNMDQIQKFDSPLNQPWTAAQSRAQFAALARLRWCIFRNAFRRKGGAGELVARILIFPILTVIAIGPIIGSGAVAYFLVSSGRIANLPLLTWGIFALWMLVVLNISQPGLSFDINTIIRFPLSFPRYLTARIFFGLLSASNVIGTLSLISADIGIAIARPSLAPWSTLVLLAFALANIFLVRMLLVWVERWLLTRRSREILTAFILFASLGFQYINLNFNPGLQGNRHRHPNTHLPLLRSIYHHIQPIAALLPPGLTGSSIVEYSQGRIVIAIASLLGVLAFAALFFTIYAWRMHREFRGENLTEVTQPNQPAIRRTPRTIAISSTTASAPARAFGLNSTVIACLQKESIYLRRNLNQLYGFIAPLFMVFLVASRMSITGRYGSYVFPIAVAYSVLGVSILSYNALGADGPGIQFYFLSPARLRDIFLAKNITGFLLTFVELVLIFAVISVVAHPPSLVIALSTISWLLFTTFVNGAVGNLRSLMAPKKIDLMKPSRGQASQLSVLIAIGILVATVGIAFAVMTIAAYLHRPWLMVPIFSTLALAAFLYYLHILNRLDTIALDHREALAEELCKA